MEIEWKKNVGILLDILLCDQSVIMSHYGIVKTQ